MYPVRGGMSGRRHQVMKPARKWQVYGLLGIFVGGHAVAIIKTREFWPFSRYPMYAKPQRSGVLTEFALVGLTEDDREVSLTARHFKIAAPMLRKQLAALAREQRRRPDRARAKLQQYMGWYHSKGTIKRKAIIGIRLYRLQYELSSAREKRR